MNKHAHSKKNTDHKPYGQNQWMIGGVKSPGLVLAASSFTSHVKSSYISSESDHNE